MNRLLAQRVLSCASARFYGDFGADVDPFADSSQMVNDGILGVTPSYMRESETPEMASVKGLFYDARRSRCTLCGESVTGWIGHVMFVPHQARLGIVERVLSGHVGLPGEVVQHWRRKLAETPSGAVEHRLPYLLSSPDSTIRRRRIIYLLRFLQSHGALREALGVYNPVSQQLGRTWEFERFEMIGDNIMKGVIQERMHRLFPPEEGGLTSRLSLIQQLIDSNEGLLRAYDFLDFDKLIGHRLAQSKFKSDVVEALYGELQTYLWATTDDPLIDRYDALMGSEAHIVRGMMEHTLQELSDVILMFALESTVENAMPILIKHYKPRVRVGMRYHQTSKLSDQNTQNQKSLKAKRMPSNWKVNIREHRPGDVLPILESNPTPVSTRHDSSTPLLFSHRSHFVPLSNVTIVQPPARRVSSSPIPQPPAFGGKARDLQRAVSKVLQESIKLLSREYNPFEDAYAQPILSHHSESVSNGAVSHSFKPSSDIPTSIRPVLTSSRRPRSTKAYRLADEPHDVLAEHNEFSNHDRATLSRNRERRLPKPFDWDSIFFKTSLNIYRSITVEPNTEDQEDFLARSRILLSRKKGLSLDTTVVGPYSHVVALKRVKELRTENIDAPIQSDHEIKDTSPSQILCVFVPNLEASLMPCAHPPLKPMPTLSLKRENQ